MTNIFLIRHGATKWSESGQHTGNTDLELTEKGLSQAAALARRLKNQSFDHVFSSPLKRAHKTCEICGYEAEIMDDLREWDYGQYEGRKTVDIRKENPTWSLFKDGAPGGDSLESIQERCDRILEKLTSLDGTTALFSSGHISRALAARYLGLPASEGRLFILSTASLSKLGIERKSPVITLWNDTSHLDFS